MTVRPASRTHDEIQYAHDLLAAVLKECGENLNADTRHGMESALDALCWVLHHDHKHAFVKNLKVLEDVLRQRGFELHDTDADAEVVH